MQLTIALLTAGLESPELETWAADSLAELTGSPAPAAPAAPSGNPYGY